MQKIILISLAAAFIIGTGIYGVFADRWWMIGISGFSAGILVRRLIKR